MQSTWRYAAELKQAFWFPEARKQSEKSEYPVQRGRNAYKQSQACPEQRQRSLVKKSLAPHICGPQVVNMMISNMLKIFLASGPKVSMKLCLFKVA